MKIKTTTTPIRNASREHFKGADLRQRVNSRQRGYDRQKEKNWRKEW
jgi:hypothetical protein